jgi:amino acid adenylation domain-containing protein
MNKREAGIIILGHPRSGTTLLRRLLDSHSRIACPPETHILSACARFLEAQSTSQGVDMGVLAGLNFAGFSDETTLSELRNFAFSFLQRYSISQQKPRWAEKTAFDAFHTDVIDQLCGGHVLFISVTRHPLDVAISTKEFCDSMGTYPAVLHEYIKQYPQPIEAFANSWLDVAQKTSDLCARHPDESISVRYEDLVASPESTLRKLLDFLGEEYEPAILDHGLETPGQIGFGDHKSYSNNSVHRSSIERWKALPQAQVSHLAKRLNPMLAHLGYPELGSISTVNANGARENYRRNLDILSKRTAKASPYKSGVSVLEEPFDPPPFSVYGLSNRTRSSSNFTLQNTLSAELCRKLLDSNVAPLTHLVAALLGLLRRVSESEEFITGVLLSRDFGDGVSQLVTTRLENVGTYRFSDIINEVELSLGNGSAGSTGNELSAVDFIIGQSHPELEQSNSSDVVAAQEGSDNRAYTSHRALFLEYDEANCCDLKFIFNEGLWSRENGARFAEHYIKLLCAMLDDPTQLVDGVYLLTPNEEKILFPARQASAEVLWRTDEKFFAEAERRPEKIAVVFGQESLTYQQLSQRVRRLAAFLQANSIEPNAVVAICLHRSLDLVTAMLAVMHAGAVYVPLDPHYPSSRIDQILEDANPDLVLTETALENQFQTTSAYKLICLDKDNWRTFDGPVATVDNLPELAYIIFTSGSTGRPKGVQVRHSGLSTFLYAMSKEPGLSEDDRLLSVTTVSFDIAALELFLPLVVGATLYIASRKDTTDGKALQNLLQENNITVFQATPATYQLLLTSKWDNTKDIRLLCGGETLPAELVVDLMERSRELWNMYGPTETTIWSTVKKVTRAESPMPIGKAIHGTNTYILNEQRSPVPVGVPGELYIAGKGVALGYLHRPDLTAESFVDDPFANNPGARMYRTGDLVRASEDGDLFCLGRLDRQVKIRGFRIELGEIEVAISQIDNVRQCVVEAYTPEVGPKRLVAYLVLEDPGKHMDIDALRDELTLVLPEYMIPNAVVTMDALPLTPNNKVDRKSLPPPTIENYSADPRQKVLPDAKARAHSSKVENAIVKCWGKYFDPGMVTPEATFVSLGGDSLTYVQATMDLEEILGVVPDGWEHLNVSELAQQKTKKSTMFVEVENSTFIRAVSIVFIVFNHAVLTAAAPLLVVAGWTNALFMVAGFLLAKFQFPMVSATNSSRPIVSSIIRILIPSTIITAAIQVYNNDLQLDDLLLYSNLVRHTSSYWFIQVLIQFLATAALILCIGSVRRFAIRRSFEFGLILLAVGLALLLSAPFDSISNERSFQVPWFRFWLFAIGWCIFFSDTKLRRVVIAYALCGLAAVDFFLVDYTLFGINFSIHHALVSIAAGFILLFVPKITLIRPLQHLSYAMAGASLFILLTHMELLKISSEAGFGGMIAMNVIASLTCGYLCWRGWDFLTRRFNRRNHEDPI